jgi:hypothetical protein
MSPASTSLTPRAAVLYGLLCMLCGAYPILVGFGVVHVRADPGTRPWVAVAMGSMFILAGLAIINGYAVAGGAQADGSLADSAPLWARVTQYVLGLAIVGLMFAVFAWVAFGSGERHFSSSISLPFVSTSVRSSEHSGRIAFGIATGFIGLLFVLFAVSGAKRLWRGRGGASQVQ